MGGLGGDLSYLSAYSSHSAHTLCPTFHGHILHPLPHSRYTHTFPTLSLYLSHIPLTHHLSHRHYTLHHTLSHMPTYISHPLYTTLTGTHHHTTSLCHLSVSTHVHGVTAITYLRYLSIYMFISASHTPVLFVLISVIFPCRCPTHIFLLEVTRGEDTPHCTPLTLFSLSTHVRNSFHICCL